MKTWIYFVRHGEVKNPKNIWYGRLPRFALSPKGKFEIEQTAKFLLTQNIDFIYSSPLLRTRQTSLIIKNTLQFSSVRFSRKLIEVHSVLQGKKFSYLEALKYDIYTELNMKKGETIQDLAQRMKKFIFYVSKIHTGKRIVAVSHGDPIMMIRAIAQKKSIEHASLRPGYGNFIKHGEIYLIECVENKLVEIKSLFIPV